MFYQNIYLLKLQTLPKTIYTGVTWVYKFIFIVCAIKQSENININAFQNKLEVKYSRTFRNGHKTISGEQQWQLLSTNGEKKHWTVGNLSSNGQLTKITPGGQLLNVQGSQNKHLKHSELYWKSIDLMTKKGPGKDGICGRVSKGKPLLT